MTETPEQDGQTPAAPNADAPKSATAVQEKPAAPAQDLLPPFRVLLHNDAVNDMVYVVETLVDLTPLNVRRATDVMFEAHRKGVALVLVTHKERAELYVEQFQSKRLKASMEPV